MAEPGPDDGGRPDEASLRLVLDVVRSGDGIVRVRVVDEDAGLDHGYVMLDELWPLIEAMVLGPAGGDVAAG